MISPMLSRRFSPDPPTRVCLVLPMRGGLDPPTRGRRPAPPRVVVDPPPLPDVPRKRLRSSSVHFAQSRSCQGMATSAAGLPSLASLMDDSCDFKGSRPRLTPRGGDRRLTYAHPPDRPRIVALSRQIAARR